MNAPSIDLKDMLVDDSNIGLTYGTDLFVGEMPTTPNACVALYDTGGFDPDAHLSYDKPTIQIRIRGERGTYSDTYDTAFAVREVLHGRGNEEINTTTRIIGIWCMGDILFVHYDENNRPIFTVNFRVHRTVI